MGKIHATKAVAQAAAAQIPVQPHIEVAVSALGAASAAPQSKWEDASSGPRPASVTRGCMMVDTGAGITLVTKAWVEAHGLKLSAPSAGSVRGASG